MANVSSHPEFEFQHSSQPPSQGNGFSLNKIVIERERRPLVDSCIALDAQGARFLDTAAYAVKFEDPIKCAKDKEAHYLLRLIVADVPAMIQLGSPLDRHAAQQVEAVYPGQGRSIVPLYPLEVLREMSLSSKEKRLVIEIYLWLNDQGAVVMHGVRRSAALLQAALSETDAAEVYRERTEPYYSQLIVQREIALLLAEKRQPMIHPYHPPSGLRFLNKKIIHLDDEELAPVIIRTEFAIAMRRAMAKVVAEAGLPYLYRTQRASLLQERVPTPDERFSSFLIGTRYRPHSPHYKSSPSLHADLGELYYGAGTAPLREYASLLALRQYLHAVDKNFDPGVPAETIEEFCQSYSSQKRELYSGAREKEKVIIRSDAGGGIARVLRNLPNEAFAAVLKGARQALLRDPFSLVPIAELVHEAEERFHADKLNATTFTFLVMNKKVFASKAFDRFLGEMSNGLMYDRRRLYKMLRFLLDGELPEAMLERSSTRSQGRELYRVCITLQGDVRKRIEAWSYLPDDAEHGAKLLLALELLGLGGRAERLRRSFYTKQALNHRARSPHQPQVIVEKTLRPPAIGRLLTAARERYIGGMKVRSERLSDGSWQCYLHITPIQHQVLPQIPVVQGATKEIARSGAAWHALQLLRSAECIPQAVFSLNEEWLKRRGQRLHQDRDKTSLTVLLEDKLHLHALDSARLVVSESLGKNYVAGFVIAAGVVVFGTGFSRQDRAEAINLATLNLLQSLDSLGFATGDLTDDHVLKLAHELPELEAEWEVTFVHRSLVGKHAQFVVFPSAEYQDNSAIAYKGGDNAEELACEVAKSVLILTSSSWNKKDTIGVAKLFARDSMIEALNAYQMLVQPHPYLTEYVTLPSDGVSFYQARCSVASNESIITALGRGPTIELAKQGAARKIRRSLGTIPPDLWESVQFSDDVKAIEDQLRTRLIAYENVQRVTEVALPRWVT